MAYKCKESFLVPKCDDNGFTIENEYKEVKEGSIWLFDRDPWRVCGGEIRLTNEDGDFEWLEISEESFKWYFESVNE